MRAAGGMHVVLLRNDGSTLALGYAAHGETNLHARPARLTYAQVTAAAFHTLLLRSDDTAVACGIEEDGQGDVPLFHPA